MSRNAFSAILIDPSLKNFKIVTVRQDNFLRDAYALIGCDIIQAAERFLTGDVIYVDEEARIRRHLRGVPQRFKFCGRGWFIGRGLLVSEIGDEVRPPSMSIGVIEKNLEFES